MKNITLFNFVIIVFLFVVLCIVSNAHGQDHNTNLIKLYYPLINENIVENKNYLKKYANKDFSAVWNYHKNQEYLGFIGDDFYRLRIRILSVTKDKHKLHTYKVIGKSIVNNTTKDFTGTFVIERIMLLNQMHWGIDDKFKNKGIKAQGVIIGKYKLFQNRNLNNSGYFDGEFAALWYLSKSGKVEFDNIQMQADSFRNNQFLGTWTSYDGSKKIKSNWGDYRIPDSGDLDVGAGEFSPNEKYLKNGWRSFSSKSTSRQRM
jgi:hypothetical protein